MVSRWRGASTGARSAGVATCGLVAACSLFAACGARSELVLPAPPPPDPPVQIAVGAWPSCALRQSGAVWCYGALWDGHTWVRDRGGVAIRGLRDVVQLCAGDTHVCARQRDGAVLCWGDNDQAEFGDPALPGGLVPQQVPGVDDAVGISCGFWRTCAVRRGGAVVCWGESEPPPATPAIPLPDVHPIEVPGETSVVEVASGGRHACVRHGDGTVDCWGEGTYGELGDGTMRNSATPVRVVGLTDAVGITAGDETSCAIRRTQALVCWGYMPNDWRSAQTLPTPAAVPAVGAVVSVGLGGFGDGELFGCALTPTGQVLCWGANNVDQLGDGTGVSRAGAASVGHVSDVVQLGVGVDRNACVLERDGTIACWGFDTHGALDLASDRLDATLAHSGARGRAQRGRSWFVTTRPALGALVVDPPSALSSGL